VQELDSVAEFPQEMLALRDVLMRVDDYNATRLKLTAEMADSSNLVKTLVIKAEDSRILGEM
jgi:Bardet-Biedl syndrome 2 protein